MTSPTVFRCVVLMLIASLSGCATIRKFNPIESHSLDARRLTQQAESAIHQSDWAEAEQKLIQAVERNPDDNRARDVLSDVLWERGAQREAIEEKSRAIQLSGRRDPIALTELGQMELTNGNPHAALRNADEAVSQDPNLADAWTLRGFALRAMDDHEAAMSAFFRSLSIRDDDARTKLEIAQIYHETGQPRRSLAILGATPKEVMADCPCFADSCYLKGVLMRELERPLDAANALEMARNNGCQQPDLPFHLAEAQLAAGEYLLAEETLAQIGDIPPNYEVALSDLRQRIAAERPAIGSKWR